MRILLAPDSFKESLSARAAVAAMTCGTQASGVDPLDIDPCPLSDGGEGFIDALHHAIPHLDRVTTRTRGPDPQDATDNVVSLGLLEESADAPRTVFVEMAQSAGLAQVPRDRRDPERLSTFGVGQAILAALDLQPDRIVLGVGGSATVDGGAGMAQALGARFFETDAEIAPPIPAAQLQGVSRIDLDGLDPRLSATRLEVWCDVDNPLLGEHGAARVFGPQKGATPDAVVRLEHGLANLAKHIRNATGRDIAATPSGGAAGGIAAGAVGMFGARIVPGADALLDAAGFDARAAQADLVFTGEGSLDAQSLAGKLVSRVAQRAARQGAPVVALVGRIDADAATLADLGLAGALEIGPGLPPAESIRRAPQLLEDAARRVAAAWPAPAPGLRAICWPA
ncbi:MAG: glycerate kinase [Planctomycetota bacterium]